MITPKEIETKVFSRAKTGGYRPEEVDSFLDEILLSYTKLLNEREQLNKKVASLTNKLEAAKEEQDQWKNTILNTQKSYNDVMQTAKKKADKAKVGLGNMNADTIRLSEELFQQIAFLGKWLGI